MREIEKNGFLLNVSSIVLQIANIVFASPEKDLDQLRFKISNSKTRQSFKIRSSKKFSHLIGKVSQEILWNWGNKSFFQVGFELNPPRSDCNGLFGMFGLKGHDGLNGQVGLVCKGCFLIVRYNHLFSFSTKFLPAYFWGLGLIIEVLDN